MGLKSQQGTVFKGALLVAGTSIGGGMLALPILTSLGGFLPSMVIYFCCWVFMASTGLLLLEVCHWMEGESNLLSMADKTLGKVGKAVAWVVYLFLFYCLTVAYVEGCGDLFNQLFKGYITPGMGSFLFVAIFAPAVLLGPSFVGRFNVFLMAGLVFFYLAFVVMGFSYVDTTLLHHRNWSYALLALPVAFTSFAYQGIVPTLSYYMGRDPFKTRLAIIIGSFIPFVAYVVWQWLILGIVPVDGAFGLAEALHNGQTAIPPLKQALQNPYVHLIGECFAFFALTTSFFGVTLGLFDFLADGLSIEKKGMGNLWLLLLVFVPPLIIGVNFPQVFLKALGIAGGFGCAILLGLLPILMVWSGRYRLKLPSKVPLPGGKTVLLLLLAFVLFELWYESYDTLLGWYVY